MSMHFFTPICTQRSTGLVHFPCWCWEIVSLAAPLCHSWSIYTSFRSLWCIFQMRSYTVSCAMQECSGHFVYLVVMAWWAKQGSTKRWVLGCVNSCPGARGTHEAIITQPRAYLLVEPCSHVLTFSSRWKHLWCACTLSHISGKIP